MLDDLVLIHDKDAQDALGLAEKQWQQLEHVFSLDEINLKPINIVLLGLGNSALAGLLATTWPKLDIPLFINNRYDIPQFVSNKTLFIASNYCERADEMLEALALAEQKKAFIVVIANSGQLAEIAQQRGYPLLKLPQIAHPCYATLYYFRALITILEKCNLLDAAETEATIRGAIDMLKNESARWRPDVPAATNLAKKLALDIVGKSIVIYGDSQTYPVAYKWKVNFNENAKNVAWAGQYPEFSQNEFFGWMGQPHQKPYAVINLRSQFEHPSIQKQFELSDKLLSGRRPSAINIKAQGNNILENMIYLVGLGSFVSTYLAILNGINPTPSTTRNL